AVPPSRWYLTGFLVPWSAPVHQKVDEDDAQGDFGFAEPSSGADDDEKDDEPPAARRGHFPSSIGLSVLGPEDATQIRVTASWGDYTPREVGPKPDIEWLRQEFTRTVAISLKAKRAEPATAPLPDSRGLEIVTSVRAVKNSTTLHGLPPGTRAVSVF